MHLSLDLSSISYFWVFVLTIAWFLLLYFAWGSLFHVVCKWLARMGLLHRIRQQNSDAALKREIRYSLSSIFLFGFSGVAMLFLIRQGWAQIGNESLGHTLFGLIILTLWNELHFYLIHRLLHLPWFYRRIHYIHHQSKIPGVYSVYSFHPIEALMLSTVPLFIMPLVNFSLLALLLFPLVSVSFNLAGHCSYRFGNGDGKKIHELASRHADHHFKNKGGFGFIFPFLDQLFNSRTK